MYSLFIIYLLYCPHGLFYFKIKFIISSSSVSRSIAFVLSIVLFDIMVQNNTNKRFSYNSTVVCANCEFWISQTLQRTNEANFLDGYRNNVDGQQGRSLWKYWRERWCSRTVWTLRNARHAMFDMPRRDNRRVSHRYV